MRIGLGWTGWADGRMIEDTIDSPKMKQEFVLQRVHYILPYTLQHEVVAS